MTATPLKGWISFKQFPGGHFFMSDSYATEAECRRAYSWSDIDGYINL